MSTLSGARRFASNLVSGAVLGLLSMAPLSASATLITDPGDAALAGALVMTFDSESPGYFASRSFLIGSDGFSVSSLADDLQIDDGFCGSFGTGGRCLDTIASNNSPNDDFDVVFTGAGVSAFGFALNALDTDWTIETYDTNDNLLGSYVVASQSPGLSGFDRRGYFGATETAPIQYFTVRSAGDDRALIDDFSFVPVPEPSAALLAGLGLLGLASVGRSRKQSGRS